MRRGRVLLVLAVGAVLIVAGTGWLANRHPHLEAAQRVTVPVAGRDGGGPVPASAVTNVRDLISGDAARVRSALSANLAALWSPTETIAPAGTSLTLDLNSWINQDNYATATGTLTMPGQAPTKVVVGFVLDAGSWRVTLVEPLP